MKKVIALLFMVMALGFIVYQVGRRQLIQNRASGGTATIILTPNANSPVSVVNGGTFNVIASLNPNNNALVGADVVLTFPTNLLTVTSIQIPTTFTNNTLHTYAPVKADGLGGFDATKVVTNANSTGKIEVSALAFDYNPSPGQVLAPQSTAVSPFVTVTFTSKALGSGQVKINYAINSTTDSNLVSNSSGTPIDVISDSTGTAIDSTVNFSVVSTPTSTPVNTPTATPTPVPTSIPTVTTTPVATPTQGTTTGNLNFKIKFQGVNLAKPNKLVRVILRQGNIPAYTFDNVAVAADATGIYSGSVNNINSGNYDVFIKGPAHLQKKMTATPLSLTTGTNGVDWSTAILIAGDFDNNNNIDIIDVASLINSWVQSSTPVTTSTQKYDYNESGFIDILDVAGVINNWTVSTVSGTN